jgi:hypothetical protein
LVNASSQPRFLAAIEFSVSLAGVGVFLKRLEALPAGGELIGFLPCEFDIIIPKPNLPALRYHD